MSFAFLGPSARVLVVLRDPAERTAVARLLAQAGCSLRTAATVAEALGPGPCAPCDLWLADGDLAAALADALPGRPQGIALLRPGAPPVPLPAAVAAALPWPGAGELLLHAGERALERAHLLCQVQQGQTEWERTFDTISDAIAICDAGGRLLRGNRALRELFRLSPEELSGQPLDTALRPLRLQERVRAAFTAGEVQSFEESPGEGRTYAVLLSPVPAPYAAPLLVLSLRDITDERRLQRRLLLGERMAAVGQLAAGLAHEINNPISFAFSNLEMAQELLSQHQAALAPAFAELPEMLAECRLGVARVRDIVRDLRTFTSTEVRTAAGEVRLDDLIDLALRLVRSEVQQRARLVYDRDLQPIPPLKGDPGKLGHVLLNLLGHALQNLPPAQAGQAAEPGAAHCITVRTRADRLCGLVELTVRDTGPPLSEEARAHLFEPFASRRRLPPELSARIGLGLAVSYEVIRRHGGEIESRPADGGGNELRVVLPLQPEARPGTPGPGARPSRGSRQLDEVATAGLVSLGRAT